MSMEVALFLDLEFATFYPKLPSTLEWGLHLMFQHLYRNGNGDICVSLHHMIMEKRPIQSFQSEAGRQRHD